ncbi:MAG: hypothetical protein ACYTG0_15700 [Planctomycetota bacterium]
MKLRRSPLWMVLAVVAPSAMAARAAEPLDVRRAVPAEAYLAVYGKHNPERDYQAAYYEEVWNTVRETRIIERAVKIATDRMSAEDIAQAEAILDELREAAAPIDLEAIAACPEGVYAQTMEFPGIHHLVVLRFAEEGSAASTEQGVKNLLGLVEKYTNGAVPVRTSEKGGAVVTTLVIPPPIPFQPTLIRIGDVLLFSTSHQLAQRSLDMLTGGEGPSKFDDPRIQEALSHLPEPEDAVMFYDGKLQFSELRAMGNFIRAVSGGDADAERVAGLLEWIFDEAAILDYEVTVEYTEGNQNRSAAYGKVVPEAEGKLLMQMLGSGEAFENWHAWVPADAVSYSLSTGVNLHPAYEKIVAEVGKRFPEARSELDEFERWQAEVDFHLDRDVLQAFSGEYVSVSLPAESSLTFGGQDSVLALRCHKPERIRELMQRGIDALAEVPFLKAQQLRLAECDDLEGFEEVSVLILAPFGVRPVIGFHDGWMIVGSNASAVEKVLEAKAGNGPTIVDSDAFKQLQMEVEGPVYSISYTNLAEQTRQIAQTLNQVGTFVPMALAMAGAQSGDDDLEPVQEVLALLPAVAQIVAKFDFLEAKVSVTQGGEDPDSYIRRSAIVVRAPSGD